MKRNCMKLLILVWLAALAGTSCSEMILDQGIESRSKNMLLLPFLTGGNSTLTVTATYNGAAASDGTGKLYVYLYNALGTGTRNQYLPVYTGSTAGAVTIGNATDITLTDLLPGDYYVLVFFDYRSGSNADNASDRYIFYNNVGSTATATKLTISGNTTVTGILFDNTFILQSGSLYMP